MTRLSPAAAALRAVATLAACADNNAFAVYQKQLNTLVGGTEADLVRGMGQPTRTTNTAASAPWSRLRTHDRSQKVTVAAMQMAEKKVWAHRSSRMAMRLRSLRRLNMISILWRWR
jgi:hypothetical protein